MASLALKALTIPALTKHSATVIFVHGLGDTGLGWQPFADDAHQDPALKHIKWILPHAPVKAVTANMGMKMPAWFDITSFDFDEDDETGMLQTVKSLNQLITTEVEAGIDPRRIVLGGFSMGGAMTLLTGLSIKEQLGGLIVLSGWLPLRNKLKSMLSSHAKDVPIFWGHGADDPLVQLRWGKLSKDVLTSSEIGIPEASSPSEGKGLSFNVYPGLQHSASDRELDDAKTWLKKVLPGN
ncbi:hypothetical protein HGRIS_014824 [Hohenbuehelia grisea]|uniref:Acyl-protein thioesterase 1 n=1 Tax=Hohenbuehelia grisea TaxID=104357 RepID=A0ABR3IQV3_9AGAR